VSRKMRESWQPWFWEGLKSSEMYVYITMCWQCSLVHHPHRKWSVRSKTVLT